MMKLTILTTSTAVTAFAPIATQSVTKLALFSTPTEEVVEEAVASIEEISAATPQSAPAAAPINGWVSDESLKHYSLPGTVAPTG